MGSELDEWRGEAYKIVRDGAGADGSPGKASPCSPAHPATLI